jgi:hypothetical protein
MNFLDCSNRRGPTTTGQQIHFPSISTTPRNRSNRTAELTLPGFQIPFPPVVTPSSPRGRGVLLRANVRSVQSTPLIDPLGKFVGMVSTHRSRPGSPMPDALGYVDNSARVSSSRSKHDLNRGNSKMGTFRMLVIGHSLSVSGACSSNCPSSIRLAAGNSALTQTEHEHE